jgi:hypothetical protein
MNPGYSFLSFLQDNQDILRRLAADGLRQKINGKEKPCGSSAFPNETALFGFPI